MSVGVTLKTHSLDHYNLLIFVTETWEFRM